MGGLYLPDINLCAGKRVSPLFVLLRAMLLQPFTQEGVGHLQAQSGLGSLALPGALLPDQLGMLRKIPGHLVDEAVLVCPGSREQDAERCKAAFFSFYQSDQGPGSTRKQEGGAEGTRLSCPTALRRIWRSCLPRGVPCLWDRERGNLHCRSVSFWSLSVLSPNR